MPTRIHFKGPLTSTLLICCAFIILGLFAIQNEFASTRQKSAQELRLIAEVKAYTLANWLHERSGDAQIIRNSRQINTAYRKWMERGDRTAKAEAQARLLEFLNAYNYQAALIADEDGHLLLSVGDPHLSEQEILPPPCSRPSSAPQAPAGSKIPTSTRRKRMPITPTPNMSFSIWSLNCKPHPAKRPISSFYASMRISSSFHSS